MGVIADRLRDLQKTYAEYDQILDFAIEIADSEENKQCEWYVNHTPMGFPFFYYGVRKNEA
jgi:hypothetical protein|nr:MAG TPA: hypothetical protein [Bacteriophage sp.]